MIRFPLATGWTFKQHDATRPLHENLATTDWLPATVPGTVHQDLLAAECIPDPFYGLNERDVQWVGESDWLYRCTFELPPEIVQVNALDLVCDGLDTFATVFLNGQHILSSNNMFVPQRVSIKGVAQVGCNDLTIVFDSAWHRGKAIEAEHGARAVWNTDGSRVYVRKAQYHYGWDWGPVLITAGIWRPITIEAYAARIAELHCPVEVAADLHSATLPVMIDVTTTADQPINVQLRLVDPSGMQLDSVNVAVVNGVVQHTFTINAPHLWWPKSHGAQPLYQLVATLLNDEHPIDQRSQRIGLRRLRLVQEPLTNEPGTTFLFEINNTPIFCGGANWIPADSFTPRVCAESYRTWLQAMVDGNMNMVRIWGGGIYEADVFYDLCDELGLMVWQDFMFACGIYPAHASFQASVHAEAEANLRRLRHHPSIVLWCGNNEDYSIAMTQGLYDSALDGDFTATAFPARELYERLLPAVCAALDPTRPYWPGSPWGGADASDSSVGDRHVWDVWHGHMALYHDYPKYAGRFVSEFGMQAAPIRATIDSFAPPAERYAQSRTFEWHNKAPDGPRRLAVYLSETLRVGDDLDSYIYASQFVQAEALKAAYSGWRRRWGGTGRYEVAGALVWQINDCWPGISWALIDYAQRPKPAYYVVRRELAPVAIGLAHTNKGIEAWAVNGILEPVIGEFVLTMWTLDGQQRESSTRAVTLAPNQATELGQVQKHADAELVLGAQLVVSGEVIARASRWPEPFKYLNLPDPEVRVTMIDRNIVQVQAKRPAKGVWLDGGDGVQWSDNMLDLLPGDVHTIYAVGIGEQHIRVRCLQ